LLGGWFIKSGYWPKPAKAGQSRPKPAKAGQSRPKPAKAGQSRPKPAKALNFYLEITEY